MANDESTDTAFEREDKQVSESHLYWKERAEKAEDEILLLKESRATAVEQEQVSRVECNRLREACAKEFADAEKWSCECQRLEKERDEARAACAEMRQQLIESRPLRADLHSDDPWCKCPRCHALSLEHGKGWLSPEKRARAISLLKGIPESATRGGCALRNLQEVLKLLEEQ